ncbi:MAG: hypothetical protein RBS34_12350 [Desulfofustis sp.]|jgi:peptide/nickel transport system substrate-binding protein|nr:hypothetical protein [Desulfofustis sp.]
MRKTVFSLLAGMLLFVGTVLAENQETLVVGVSSDIHTLDPGVSSDNYDWRQIYPCYDQLVKYKVVNGEGSTEVEPQAADVHEAFAAFNTVADQIELTTFI